MTNELGKKVIIHKTIQLNQHDTITQAVSVLFDWDPFGRLLNKDTTWPTNELMTTNAWEQSTNHG